MTVSNIDDLRKIITPEINKTYHVLGYYSPGDEGGGDFFWDSAFNVNENNGTIIESEKVPGAGRWRRIFDGNINVRWFGAKGDGINDDTSAFVKALGLKRTIFIPNGAYIISSTLKVSPGCDVIGASWNTLLRTSLNIPFFSNENAAGEFLQGVSISNMRLQNLYPVNAATGAGATSYHIHLIDPTFCVVDKVWMISAFGHNNYNTANRGGVYFQKTSAPLPTFVNRVDNSLIEGGSIRIDTSDSKVHQTYIWGYAIGTPAIEIQTGNVSIENCDIVPSYQHGGIYLVNSTNCRVTDCFFDGNGTIPTGWGIIITGGTSHTITGNTFWSIARGGIWITDASLINIVSNEFKDNNVEDNAYADVRIQGNSYVISTVIATNNSFYIASTRNDKGYAIEEVTSTGYPPSGNDFSNNRILGYYQPPSILNLTGNSITTSSTGPGLPALTSIKRPLALISNNYTLSDNDYTIIARTSGITLTLPAASSCSGRIYNIVNYNTGGNVNISLILRNGAVATVVPNNAKWTIQSEGVNWYVISE